MKTHTSSFKENIKLFGRELDSKITYELDGETIELGSEQLNSITPHYEGAILKSVMKQLDIDSNIEIPIGTILTYQFGLKVNDEYEYINFGNYIVKSVEKQEDTYSYKITCYDKMLYAMKDYENSDITFPITIRDYISAICEKVGLVFANESEQFANYDKVISNELYLDNEGRSLGYTFRDVLDELAEVTASTICINKDDELEIRYIKDVGELTNVSGTDLTLETDSEVQLDNFELEGKTTQASTPTPDYPSELVSVGYENLLKLDSEFVVERTTQGITKKISNDGGVIVSGTPTQNNSFWFSTTDRDRLLLKAGTYTMSASPSVPLYIYIRKINSNTRQNISTNTFTVNEDFYVQNMALGLLQGQEYNETFYIQITKGSQAHSYIPYGKYGIEVKTTDENNNTNTYLYTLDNPLRSIGDTKDLLYIKNGMLYVDRKIGNVIYNGSEPNWAVNGNVFYRTISDKIKSKTKMYSNYFSYIKVSWSQLTNYTMTDDATVNTIFIKDEDYSSVSTFKTWLSTHNTEVQYVLATPYTEELGSVETPSTYNGITYLNTTDTNVPTMNVSYVSEIDTIDEEYLKDVNVNFGEKFGKVNTLVLSRGGDGDKISLSIPSDLADENKVAIQITDNQIMNDNNRADYMQAILNQLNGLEYYINDFSSTGICYLDLCDRYQVKIGDNVYKCIMFNDEVDITQGLEEFIYTDMQEENEQEYKYMSSDDRGITQATIIAKKNEGTIEEITQSISGENGIGQRLNRVETKQTDTDRTIDIISTNIDADGNITEVTTTTGFTFNAEGMTIADNQTNFKALHRNTGTYYYDGDTITGQYTKDGSKQKDLELFGVYYYGKNDIDDTPMFVAQLYTDENGEECFGHFINRGD